MRQKTPCFYSPTVSQIHVCLTWSHANVTVAETLIDFLSWSHLLKPQLLRASATSRDGLECVSDSLFLRMRMSPSSSLHPQCNLISLWHGLNFPLGGTFIPRHPSTLRLLMECVECEADKNLSALKWGDKSSLDTHTHYIDIYSLVKKVVYWAHAPLCPYSQSWQISTQCIGMR